jgi:hypothetical protein
MNSFVKTLAGKTLTLEMEPFNTIADLKEKIGEKASIPYDSVRAMWVVLRLLPMMESM